MASHFNDNINKIKRNTLEWIRGKRLRDEEDLEKIKAKVEQLEKPRGKRYVSNESRKHLI